MLILAVSWPQETPGHKTKNHISLSANSLDYETDKKPANLRNLKLCPKDWLLHENKCYWISGEKQTWNESRDNCRAKDSELAILKEEAELHYIHHVTKGAQMLWIGLSANSKTRKWLWMDNSPYNNKEKPNIMEAQGNSCGMVKGPKVISESCSAVTKWICETEALII
ncbi:killer cell lectin-like receptor subfamily B member 1B allele C [Pseudonaja textilis]|uniref:killer cell lectin-like receptor subfamily B member 1B allele C n=1 Tax=Pseudonaja textilis TaxID=8673 RepID=UPI000EAA7FA5|nr:killer cell lectin-like receptor subfamily B member 1B allele C [Pseudonaja textilis]